MSYDIKLGYKSYGFYILGILALVGWYEWLVGNVFLKEATLWTIPAILYLMFMKPRKKVVIGSLNILSLFAIINLSMAGHTTLGIITSVFAFLAMVGLAVFWKMDPDTVFEDENTENDGVITLDLHSDSNRNQSKS